MNIIRADALKPNSVLQLSLYSTRTGGKFLHAGNVLTQDNLSVLKRRGDVDVYGLTREEEVAVGLREEGADVRPSRKLDPQELRLGLQIHSGVYDCRGILVWATVGRKVSQQDLESLEKLETAAPGSIYVWDSERLDLRDDPIVRALAAHFCRVQDYKLDKKEVRPLRELRQIASTEPLQAYRQRAPLRSRSLSEKKKALKHFDDSLNHLEQTLRFLNQRGEIRLRPTALREQRQVVHDTVETILRDGDLASGLLNQAGEASYLLSHAFKTSLLAVQVGTAIGLAKQEVMDLGLASILQDVGMTKVPESIPTKATPLLASELSEIHRHPIYGVELLSRSEGLPGCIPTVVIQSHERLDGSGYPSGMVGERMHPLAKILSAVNVYVAMVSPRPYRPPVGTYDAVYYLLQGAHNGVLDSGVVRNLLNVLSLFPVGTVVALNTGEVARVVGSNEGAYTRPLVSVIAGSDGLKRPPRLADLLEEEDLEITRILSPEELPALDIFDGF